MNRLARSLGVLAVLAGSSALAHAATVGQLVCNAEGRQLSVNLSYFTFGAAQVPSTTTSTSPTLAYQLLDVHAAFSQFGPFLEAADKKITKCTVFSTLADGTQAEIVFSGITLNSVTAVARTPYTANAPAAMYTEAAFQYTSLKVKSSGGSDDGGTDGGWYNPRTPAPPTGGGSQ